VGLNADRLALTRGYCESILQIRRYHHRRAIRALVTDDARHCRASYGCQDTDNANNDQKLHDGEARSNIFVIIRHDFHAILPTRGGGRERGAPALPVHIVIVTGWTNTADASHPKTPLISRC
ncbi:MAG TPA: hypothetical protein VEZ51_05515, partial [Gemmatimonadaceae bacterium]|nr:hypothetical protein [Gemmatimonadaceae bacterium]